MKIILTILFYFLLRLGMTALVLMPMVAYSLVIQAWYRVSWFFLTPQPDERAAVRDRWGIPWPIIWCFLTDKPLD